MLKGYKYRIYPSEEQKELIQKTFGCVRFVYNQTLNYRKELYDTEKIGMSKLDCSYYVNELKKKYDWLKEVGKFSLINSVFNMDNAYKRFFKEHAGYPKFKSKHNNYMSYKTNCCKNGRGNRYSIEFDFDNNKIKLPKLKWIKAKISRTFDGKIKSATVSQTPSGKYFVSILIEEEQKELPKMEKQVGIDLGIKDLVITSDGEKFDNLKLIKIGRAHV